MEQEENTKCPNKAEYILPWAGKLMKMCKIHANGLCVLAGAIGAPIQAQVIEPVEQCMGPNDLDMYKQAQEDVESTEK